MASKYLKNSEGIVRAITSNNLQLEKPLLNENYDIEVHNRNMDKIDSAIQEVKGKVDGLELTAERVSIADPTNKFEATNVEDALLENKTSILNNTELVNQALTKANEAFQRGDNVKTQLVGKLISEGLDVSTNNTFEELINSIALGKKWASGTSLRSSTTSKFNYLDGSTYGTTNYYEVVVNGFTPSIIILFSKISSNGNEVINIMSKNYTSSTDDKAIRLSVYSKNNSNISYSFKLDGNTNLGNGVYRFVAYLTTTQADWIAFE